LENPGSAGILGRVLINAIIRQLLADVRFARESGQNSRRLGMSALRQKRTFLPTQFLSAAQHQIGVASVALRR
jgi:hypothetical protein